MHTKVQALKREFEIIFIKRNEKVDEYSNHFFSNCYQFERLGGDSW